MDRARKKQVDIFKKSDSPLTAAEEQLVYRIIGCAITVHRELGTGFKESIYQRAFCLELEEQGIPFECEKRVVVEYKRWEIAGQRVDLVVGGIVVVELKAVPKLRRLHRAQVLSYMKTLQLPVGLLFNFNSEVIRTSMRRIVRSEFRSEPEAPSRP